MKTPRRNLLLLFLGLLAVLVVCPMLGSSFAGWNLLFSTGHDEISRVIFLRTRLPRLLLSLLVGASLALSGAVYQSIFRNALASPFTLGTASGGAFGAVLAIKLGFDFSLIGLSTVTLSAFAGSLLSLAVVYFLGRHRGGVTTTTMLLAGVTVGFFFSAMTLFAHYLMDYTQSYRVVLWTMGSLDITEYGSLLKIAPLIIVCLLLLTRMARDYNQICLGEDIARTRGVDVEAVKRKSFILTSLAVGASVSIAGPIGFVGLVVPHVLRLLIGSDYRVLLPASILGGGAFLALCDTAARLLISPSEIPVGVITALLGGPFFLFLLLRKSPEEF
ncbi:MAG: iron ABC transporter permease [Fibrobacterota bacterium]